MHVLFFQYTFLPIFCQVIGYISGKNRLNMTKQHSNYTGLVIIMILKIEQCTYYAEYVTVTYYTCHAIYINMKEARNMQQSLHNQDVSFYCKTDIKVMSWSNIHIITWWFANFTELADNDPILSYTRFI